VTAILYLPVFSYNYASFSKNKLIYLDCVFISYKNPQLKRIPENIVGIFSYLKENKNATLHFKINKVLR